MGGYLNLLIAHNLQHAGGIRPRKAQPFERSSDGVVAGAASAEPLAALADMSPTRRVQQRLPPQNPDAASLGLSLALPPAAQESPRMVPLQADGAAARVVRQVGQESGSAAPAPVSQKAPVTPRVEPGMPGLERPPRPAAVSGSDFFPGVDAEPPPRAPASGLRPLVPSLPPPAPPLSAPAAAQQSAVPGWTSPPAAAALSPPPFSPERPLPAARPPAYPPPENRARGQAHAASGARSAPAPSTPVPSAAAPPTIEIHIGRIDVRAISPSLPEPSRRPAPALSLGDYLKRTSGGEA